MLIRNKGEAVIVTAFEMNETYFIKNSLIIVNVK